MIDRHFVLLGAVFNALGQLGYLRDTLRDKAKPNRITWLLWAVAPLIAWFAELGQGVGLTSLMTFMVGFGPLLVFIASFVNRRAYWRLSTFDIVCGILSVSALVVWRLTGEGNVAIALSIVTDALAGIPTVVKTYRGPASESYGVFLFGAISAVITLLTIDRWSLATAAWPVYIFLMCMLIFSIGNIRRSRQQIKVAV